MMSLLGSLLGFGSSFLPEVLSYFKANQLQKHRMEMMQLETQLAQKRSEMKLVELDKQAGAVFVLLLLMPSSDCL